jgi:DNA polymerase-1
MSEKQTLLLVDGSSYLYRAFHAMPDLRANPADPTSPATGAIRGMINMMTSLKKEVPAEYAVCVFDAPGPTFRDEIYPDYKANRSPMPPDLRAQIEPIHEVVRLMGWHVLAVPGVEADDVIGTLAHQADQSGIETIISSGDKDLSQLVNENIWVMDTMSGKKRDIAGVTQEFGVPPSLMLDYQTLVGDTVDNVPGVEKVGPKTAVKWLSEYGSLENVIKEAPNIKGVVGENLRKALDWLPKGRELLTIKTDCDLSAYLSSLPAFDQIKMGEPDLQGLLGFYKNYGFKGLVNALESALQSGNTSADALGGTGTGGVAGAQRAQSAQSAKRTQALGDASMGGDLQADLQEAPRSSLSGPTQYETITSWSQFDRWLEKLKSAQWTALDTETTSLVEMQAKIVGLSFSVRVGEAAYIPLTHDYPGVTDQLPIDEVLKRLQGWLEDPNAKKIGQHIKYDRHVFANHGIQVRGYVHDTMLQSYVLEVHRPHNLASLAERHVGRTGISYESLCGKGAHEIKFNQVEIEKASTYACEDTDQTLDVHLCLWPKIESDEKLNYIYQLEIQSSETLFRIERNGVLIDAPTLAKQSQQLGERIGELEREAYELAQQPFNLGSPKQIAEIFFDKLGLPVIKKTPKGAPSTDEEVLEKLAEDYPLPAKILEHRGISKLKSTYTDKLAQMAQQSTGRVHTHYAQAVAVTGRLSSNEPNLQNIPIRTPEGRRVREAFIAPGGSVIASADYSQIELRIMAHLSEDEALLRAFHEGVDVHKATAAEIFSLSSEEVSSEQRRYAKVINFGLIYGMSAFGLAKALGIDNTAAKNYIDRYFQRFAGVKRYMEETRATAKQKGFVQTVFGRRLYLPEINSPNGPRRAGAERAAINAPMQGTAADLIKMSMVSVQNELDRLGKRTKMIMQVHDELVFEVPQEEVDWLKESIPRLMAEVATLKVPLLAELGVGPNWDQAH